VDQSTLIGEPVPVMKSTGDFLLAGTRNISRPLVAVVYKEQHNSSLGQLLDSIATATEQKSDIQEKVEKLNSYFVSGILTLTVVGFVASFLRS
jgi:cation transport ATPase